MKKPLVNTGDYINYTTTSSALPISYKPIPTVCSIHDVPWELLLEDSPLEKIMPVNDEQRGKKLGEQE